MKTIILGGGTFQPIANHLAVSAPAFGGTAKKLTEIISKRLLDSKLEPELVLTKMADSNSKLVTNEDVSNYIDEIVKDKTVKCIIFNIAMCDFKGRDGSFHGERMDSSKSTSVILDPTNKVIDKIRIARPDIYLIGFKTTANKSINEQFEKGLKMMKRSKCNLVLCNDVVTRKNFIITPEETIYGVTVDREEILELLCDIIDKRIKCTYTPTNFFKSNGIIKGIYPMNFSEILAHVIKRGGFICNNGNGFTPGHFCYRISNQEAADIWNSKLSLDGVFYASSIKLAFFSSIRKVNHNEVYNEGMTLVIVDKHDKVWAHGPGKPSVGARSQALMLENNPEYDYIIHTHNPKSEFSVLKTVEQLPYQCGSTECGINTNNGLETFLDGDLKGVFLEKHGANFLIKKDANVLDIIRFMDDNIEFGIKIK